MVALRQQRHSAIHCAGVYIQHLQTIRDEARHSSFSGSYWAVNRNLKKHWSHSPHTLFSLLLTLPLFADRRFRFYFLCRSHSFFGCTHPICSVRCDQPAQTDDEQNEWPQIPKITR